MSVHNFDDSLQKELASHKVANSFYTGATFKAKEIVRFTDNSEEHLNIQRKDIDANIRMWNDDIWSVSEKFREHDYNDVLLEIYSKYPDTFGWIHNSYADRLAYFFPSRIFWIDKRALCAFCLETLFPLIQEEDISQLIVHKMNSLSLSLNLKGTTYACKLTQAPNNTDGAIWNTISISVPFDLLGDFNIRYQIFKLRQE